MCVCVCVCVVLNADNYKSAFREFYSRQKYIMTYACIHMQDEGEQAINNNGYVCMLLQYAC